MERRAAAKRWGRIAAAAVGLLVVYFLLRRVGFALVWTTLIHGAIWFPTVVLLEAGILSCTVGALRLLYGEDRFKIPARALVHAGLLGYAAMGLLPAGRSFAESTRAAYLSRYSTAPRAWVAAAKLQGIALLANSAISLLAVGALYHATGLSLLTSLVAGNAAVTAVLGAIILFAGRHSRLGARVGRRFPRASDFGQHFDRTFKEGAAFPLSSFGWEFGGRLLQVIQNGILVFAVGGALGITPALCSEGLHLVGVAAGDLIPGQLGATEASFGLSARALSLRPSDAVVIALLAHLAQMFWVCVALIMQLMREAGRFGLSYAANSRRDQSCVR